MRWRLPSVRYRIDVVDELDDKRFLSIPGFPFPPSVSVGYLIGTSFVVLLSSLVEAVKEVLLDVDQFVGDRLNDRGDVTGSLPRLSHERDPVRLVALLVVATFTTSVDAIVALRSKVDDVGVAVNSKLFYKELDCVDDSTSIRLVLDDLFEVFMINAKRCFDHVSNLGVGCREPHIYLISDSRQDVNQDCKSTQKKLSEGNRG